MELKNRNQWAISNNKAPFQINGEMASSTDKSTWTSFENVINKSDQVGFFLSKHDPYTVIDLDNCIKDGVISDEAKTIVELLNSYTEISQSGTGLHIFVKAKKPGNRSKNTKKGFEMYDKERFMVMTGNHLEGTPLEVNEAQDAINYLYDMYFPNKETERKKSIQQSPQLTDKEVLKIASNAKNGDKFKALFNGEIDGYGSHSEADQALCNLIAFYTQDPEQIDRIFSSSRLYRKKWDRQDYKARTIQKALSGIKTTYQKPSAVHDFRLYVNEEKKIIKGSWWKENENNTKTFLHTVMAQYILQEFHIVRYPDAHGDLYIYNPETGIYENDKSCRRLRSIIRELELLKNNHVREVQEYILDMSQVRKEISKEYVALNNGLLHFPTMKFIDFTPDVFVINKIPTDYNPNAYDVFVDTTLNKVTKGHEPSRKNIEEMFACILYPKVLVPKMFYLYGRTAHNGKSSILYLIHKTFNLHGGNISAVPPQKLADNTFAGSSLYGKLANIVDDLPDVQINDAGLLKSIITGGYVDIEQKGKDSRTVEMSLTMIIASNYYPNFKENGKQINRRLYIIPFEHDFSTDPDCVSEVESMERLSSPSAREYCLKLAVEALGRMLEKDSPNKLTENEKANEAGQAFSEYNDPLIDFFFEYDKKFFEEVRGTDALKAYKNWCEDNNIKHPLGQKRFKDAVCSKYNMEWKDKKLKINGEWKTVKGFKSK